ncbi:DUF4226 domain-containing protein [Mycobacterium botniense]|uniref:Biofilm regulator BssS n=1 Tax=Mycobacterium botniense TaxID=84962 RepID=A0A7I9XUV9_9MYCO|nr:DUF4226 domain-containing protein [Mycobacterium botniense]GFG73739.1 hypothetical protein MBOT_11040 [Mycobacterium botniense]
MAEQTGHAVAALQSRQAGLAQQYAAAVDADRALADVVTSAHTATLEGARRLDEIGAEIESAVQKFALFATDTPIGAREFHRFLTAKQREIIAVVAHARELAEAKKTALESLRSCYAEQ